MTYDDKIIGYPVYFDTSALVYNEDYLRTWATQQAEKELSGSSDNDEPVGEGEEIIEEILFRRIRPQIRLPRTKQR